MQSPVATPGNNRFTGQFRAMHKEQQRNGGGQPFKEGNKTAAGREEEASRTVHTSVNVKGSRTRKSFINTPEIRCQQFAFFVLRNKIDLLHPYMNY
jgi:hypothetical protein